MKTLEEEWYIVISRDFKLVLLYIECQSNQYSVKHRASVNSCVIVLEQDSTTFLSPLKNGWLFSWALGEGGMGGRFHQKATTARAAPTAAGMVYTQICGIAVKYMQVKLQINHPTDCYDHTPVWLVSGWW